MTPVDIAVVTAIGIVLGYPYLTGLVKSIPSLPSLPKPVPTVSSEPEDVWRQRWVATLIDLQTDLEQRSQDEQVELCRNMIWQLLGGEVGEA